LFPKRIDNPNRGGDVAAVVADGPSVHNIGVTTLTRNNGISEITPSSRPPGIKSEINPLENEAFKTKITTASEG
jgi:hypothetical protein